VPLEEGEEGRAEEREEEEDDEEEEVGLLDEEEEGRAEEEDDVPVVDDTVSSAISIIYSKILKSLSSSTSIALLPVKYFLYSTSNALLLLSYLSNNLRSLSAQLSRATALRSFM
jgi:hypothetical protein